MLHEAGHSQAQACPDAFFPAPMRGYPFDEWDRLVGATVEVRLNGNRVRTGLVDAATPDGSIIWLSQDGPLDRVLIEKAQGYEMWISPAQLRERETQ